MPLTISAVHPRSEYDPPFDADDGRFTERWWSDSLSAHSDDRAFAFLEEGDAVARVLVTCDRTPQDEYVDLPQVHRGAKIWYFEVARTVRRRGIGRRAIDLLAAELGGRRLFAFSEGADEFWSGIGWTHYPRADGDTRYQRLYIQPETRRPVQLVRRIR